MKVHFILPVTIRYCFSFLQTMEDIHVGLMRMYVTFHLLDNIYIRFGNTLYRQIVGIPMGTKWAPLMTI